MKQSHDVVIVGGAVIGSAVAYFLTANSDFTGSVLVVERDPTYAKAATSLSSSSIRTQFSNPINVKISQYGSDFIKGFGDAMQVAGEARPDLNFHQGGYLFLAATADQEQTLRENHAVQRLRGRCGAVGSKKSWRAPSRICGSMTSGWRLTASRAKGGFPTPG